MSHDVHIRGVEKTYANGFRALHGVHLRLPQRRLTTLLGPSGCGKTTLLRLVAGLEKPDCGTISFGANDVTTQGAAQRDISLVFQNYALFPYLNVQDNVRYGLRQQGLSAASQQERSAQALALVGLGGLEQRMPHELSGGQQQRTALARALALQPSMVLLDEPLSNIDTNLRRSIREDIRQLQQRLGLTVLYVTHDHAEAMSVSDLVVVMREGRVVQIGSPRDIYQQPQSEFLAGFMGDATVFDATVDEAGTIHLGPLAMQSVPDGVDSSGLTLRQGAVRIVVRPEAWRLAPACASGLAGKVLHSAYLGRATEVRVQTALGDLLVLTHSHGPVVAPGAPVSVFLSRQGVSMLLPALQSSPTDLPVENSRRLS
ncbi:ABC transporter ATP-binding protein [Rhodoferax sp.]|jgi:iron(III) transport system ATP-binding protein|uniref:ABC transporter ATP-binding protein n=1 Tax=Rhodoferax sp. TaxID=50421 RepID=UPI003782F9D0